MSVSRCGSCTLCCRIARVPELNKPVDTWCKHCDIGKGCKIHESRPDSCRNFECLWYTNEDWPADLQPSECKVMFERLEGTDVIVAQSSRGYENAWQKPLVQRFIRMMVEREGYAVIVRTEGVHQKHMILPKNRTRESVWAEVKQFAERVGITEK